MRSVSKFKRVTKVAETTIETKEGSVYFDLIKLSNIDNLPASIQADIDEMNDIMREINSISDEIESVR